MSSYPIKSNSQGAQYYNFLFALMANKGVTVPQDYREKVLAVKGMYDKDPSGLAGTLADFMINEAIVGFAVQTANENLQDTLNEWLRNINEDYAERIDVGIKALAKEYFRERWKGSSHIVLDTRDWKKDQSLDLVVPKYMVFLAGEDIIATRPRGKAHTLTNLEYKFRVNSNKKLSLVSGPDRQLFIRKPFEDWASDSPTPFAVKRGIYQNVKFMELLFNDTSKMCQNFWGYIMQVILGSAEGEKMNKTVSAKDLKEAKRKFEKYKNSQTVGEGKPISAQPWDMKLEHFVPPYEEVTKSAIYSAITQRILSGFGVLEVMRSKRQEDVLNPKPMISEIMQGVQDFASLMEDVFREIKKRNQIRNPKYFKNKEIKVWHPPFIKDFLTADLLEHLRSAYDRGNLSKESYNYILGIQHETEVIRRAREIKSGEEELLFPQVVQNNDTLKNDAQPEPKNDEETDEDKKGPEKVNYKKSQELANQRLAYEDSPYKKIKDLPNNVKELPQEAKVLWLQRFNLEYLKSEDQSASRKQAWVEIKKDYEKIKNKWVKKNKS